MPGAFVSSSTRRDGGGREIRTPEGSPPSGFQDRRNRPLCHPSGAQYSIQARPLLIVAAAAVLLVPLVPEVGTNRRAPRGVADREPYGERARGGQVGRAGALDPERVRAGAARTDGRFQRDPLDHVAGSITN